MTGVRELTQQFHETYERLAPSFGYETRKDSAVPWSEVPEANRHLMEAVVAEVTGPILQRVAELEDALRLIGEQQSKTLQMIKTNGFVFTDIGQELGNWQHLAFAIYTDLCEVDTIARGVLE